MQLEPQRDTKISLNSTLPAETKHHQTEHDHTDTYDSHHNGTLPVMPPWSGYPNQAPSSLFPGFSPGGSPPSSRQASSQGEGAGGVGMYSTGSAMSADGFPFWQQQSNGDPNVTKERSGNGTAGGGYTYHSPGRSLSYPGQMSTAMASIGSPGSYPSPKSPFMTSGNFPLGSLVPSSPYQRPIHHSRALSQDRTPIAGEGGDPVSDSHGEGNGNVKDDSNNPGTVGSTTQLQMNFSPRNHTNRPLPPHQSNNPSPSMLYNYASSYPFPHKSSKLARPTTTNATVTDGEEESSSFDDNSPAGEGDGTGGSTSTGGCGSGSGMAWSALGLSPGTPSSSTSVEPSAPGGGHVVTEFDGKGFGNGGVGRSKKSNGAQAKNGNGLKAKSPNSGSGTKKGQTTMVTATVAGQKRKRKSSIESDAADETELSDGSFPEDDGGAGAGGRNRRLKGGNGGAYDTDFSEDEGEERGEDEQVESGPRKGGNVNGSVRKSSNKGKGRASDLGVNGKPNSSSSSVNAQARGNGRGTTATKASNKKDKAGTSGNKKRSMSDNVEKGKGSKGKGKGKEELDDDDDDGSVINGNGGKQPQKKKKASRACWHCQKAHLTCDDARPCARCVKRGFADSCQDGYRKKAKYLQDFDDALLERRRPSQPPADPQRQLSNGSASNEQEQVQHGQQTEPETPDHLLSALPILDSNDPSSPMPLLYDPSSFASEFGSEAANLEYAILSSMLMGSGFDSLPGSDGRGSMGMENMGVNPATMSLPGQSQYPTSSMIDGGFSSSMFGMGATSSSALPSSSMQSASILADSPFSFPTPLPATDEPTMSSLRSTTEQPPEVMQAYSSSTMAPSSSAVADPSIPTSANVGSSDKVYEPAPAPSKSALSSEPTSEQSKQAQYEAQARAAASSSEMSLGTTGMGIMTPEEVYKNVTKPYRYTEGYHFLIRHLKERFEKNDILRIVRALSIFRPSLIALQMPLTEEDEVFLEKCFQRTLIEFDKLISFSGTPTVVWRRTGEICLVGTEFCLLTEWSREELLGKKKYIYEIFDTSSTVEYYEALAAHAFENTTQAVMTTCVVLTPRSRPVPCCFCFSIKRDLFNLPSIVVGQFLPILN